jgi:LysR family glycine cleavage system transcriptional activator
MRNIPSIAALRALEASARKGSFTLAALELGQSQASISQQIRALEQHLGVALFIRKPGQIQLTEAARAYLQPVREALSLLTDATQEIVRTEDDNSLTVNSLATFTFRYLVPRLGEFRALHPAIALRVAASVSQDEFQSKTWDVAIRLEHEGADWSGMRVDRLFLDRAFPVCAPSLIATDRPLSQLSDLSNHLLIRSGFSFLFSDLWPAWLASAGLPDALLKNELVFEFALAALEAASKGQGLAMAREPFVRNELQQGTLIRPFEIEVSSGAAYFLVSPLTVANRPKVRAFREWLLGGFTDSA